MGLGDKAKRLRIGPLVENSEIPEHVHFRNQYGAPNNKLDLNLPPLHDLDEIYRCITQHAMDAGLLKFLDHMKGKALRVATVCSGTESPLLALEMVRKCKSSLPSDHLVRC